jgi:hypothetical protein
MGKRFGFALEAFEDTLDLSGGEILTADDLQSHVTLEASVEGFVDRRHAALTELFENAITTEGCADQLKCPRFFME